MPLFHHTHSTLLMQSEHYRNNWHWNHHKQFVNSTPVGIYMSASKANMRIEHFSTQWACDAELSDTQQLLTKQWTVLSNEVWTIITLSCQSLHTITTIYQWYYYLFIHGLKRPFRILFTQPPMRRMHICFTDFFCFFFAFSVRNKNTRQLFSGTAEWIFMKLLPNDSGENVM